MYPIAGARRPTIDHARSTLIEASRQLIARGGLSKFSLRTLARESGWTMGELAYRVGKKDDLLVTVVETEAAAWRDDDALWLERFTGVTAFDDVETAAIIGSYIDHRTRHSAPAMALRYELLVEPNLEPRLAAAIEAWIAEGQAFWLRVFDGRRRDAAAFARVARAYVESELLFSLSLHAEPAYRIAREICTHRLTSPASPHDAAAAGDLFGALSAKEPEAGAKRRRPGGKARKAAAAAAELLVELGPKALTHRAVGARMNLTGSAIAHHFPTGPELLGAAVNALDETARELRKAEARAFADTRVNAVDDRGSSAIHPKLWRAMIFVALAAARDPSFKPLALRLRLERGHNTHTESLRRLTAGGRPDRWTAQVSSLVVAGSHMHPVSEDQTSADRLSRIIADVERIMPPA